MYIIKTFLRIKGLTMVRDIKINKMYEINTK